MCASKVSMLLPNSFANLSTMIVTYAELKDISNLNEPLDINQLINIKNEMFSPTSTYMITSLLLNGANEGLTENELKFFLKVPNKMSLNGYLAKLTNLNNMKYMKYMKLKLRTAVFVQKSVQLTDDFVSVCENKFNCLISEVDFRDNLHVAHKINLWAQIITNWMTDFVISDIDKDTKIVLISVIYLNSRWLYFPEKTEKHKFHVSSSELYFVPTIKFEKFIYGEIAHWNVTFIEILFLNNNVTMTVFLPNEDMEPGNLEYLEKEFNLDEFQSIRNTYKNDYFDHDMELYLPMFTSECIHNMRQFFRHKNVSAMFEDIADFTRLSKIPLKVNNIIQTISVNIHEESSQFEVFALPVRERVRIPLRKPGPLQKLIVDRPFFYFVTVYGELMFAGNVRVPNFVFMRDEL
ncbi:alaserpin-like isoform X2 [Cataglyphis hispanica]|nr:alaserpin-like isoform X2 [Cataglyphis hispanica]